MKTLRACWYEFKLAILRTVRYKISFVSDIVVFCVIFFVILFTNAGYSLSLAYNSSESQGKSHTFDRICFLAVQQHSAGRFHERNIQ